MSQKPPLEHRWLALSEAAEYLGVHFTTLRRWTDDGKVPCIRTPGGRRRYRLAELTAFLASLQQGESRALTSTVNNEEVANLLSSKHIGITNEPWYSRLDEGTRATMRSGGRQLMAVLMQYATRSNGGEAFLQEGQRLAAAHGEASYRAGLTLVETLRAFLLVRRSINDAVHRAGALAGAPDADTWRLYDRMATFLDALLIATVAGFEQAQTHALPVENLSSSNPDESIPLSAPAADLLGNNRGLQPDLHPLPTHHRGRSAHAARPDHRRGVRAD